MTKEEFCVLNNIYEASLGRAQCLADLFLNQAVKSHKTYQRLAAEGFLSEKDGTITPEGIKALEPYRVDSAVILAAGSATRFIPLSLEQPKGLYEVKGEKLIERQIRQLQDAGIDNIIVVLGYKKDMFAYLEEKYSVKLLFNPLYNAKNNIESILTAKQYLSNSYICVCDSYYSENPFHKYEYQSFCSGFFTEEKEAEMYADVSETGQILRLEKGKEGGRLLLGHTFWKKSFSDAFLELAENDREKGIYDQQFWEWLWKDNLNDLPAMYYKEYESGMIHEFDYFEQLREFDTGYLNSSHSDIIRNIKLVFRCDEEDIVDFRTVSEGLTNTSFIFQIEGVDYIYRHPGDGTDKIINRRNEKTSLKLANKIGLDPTYVYMDSLEGWKISRYIHTFREPDYRNLEDSEIIVASLKKLHTSSVQVDYGMKPWEDALVLEQLIKEKTPDCFDQYEDLKERIRLLYDKTKGDGIEKCFCHGDTYKHNWMIEPNGNVILIDWEYSGTSDPGIDLGYYIVDAMYDYSDAKQFIRMYLGKDWNPQKEFHFLAYTAIIAYYWFVWALYRESCGAVIGVSLQNWHEIAETYSAWLLEQYLEDKHGEE